MEYKHNIRGRIVDYISGELALVITDDGSHTIYHQSLDETYHSLSGAITESQHVFIREGLFYCLKDDPVKETPLNILEIGWGTGLNSILTMEKALPYRIKINYVGLEPCPLPSDMSIRLNYPKFIDSRINRFFSIMHKAEGNIPHQLSPLFNFQKIYSRLADLPADMIYEWTSSGGFNLVYFDAFGISKQNEPWEENNFIRLREVMAKESVLVTYASNRILQKILNRQGFKVETIPGPPPKREMTRAMCL